ncbi:MAG: hypothetical protein OIF32_05980, partial [Campylobacterales bacterium]|nr:hypothetical protein [Campylobacterales bacterium]
SNATASHLVYYQGHVYVVGVDWNDRASGYVVKIDSSNGNKISTIRFRTTSSNAQDARLAVDDSGIYVSYGNEKTAKYTHNGEYVRETNYITNIVSNGNYLFGNYNGSIKKFSKDLVFVEDLGITYDLLDVDKERILLKDSANVYVYDYADGSKKYEPGFSSDTFSLIGTNITNDITVNISSTNPNVLTISPSTLTFTSSNGSIPQTVTISEGIGGGQVVVTISGTDGSNHIITTFDVTVGGELAPEYNGHEPNCDSGTAIDMTDSVEVSLSKGFNLLSLPSNSTYTKKHLCYLFGQVNQISGEEDYLTTFSKDIGWVYFERDKKRKASYMLELDSKDGFWIKSIEERKIKLPNSKDFTDEKIKITEGWSLIGIHSEKSPKELVTMLEKDNPTKIVDTLWTYEKGAWKIHIPNSVIDGTTATSIPRISTIKSTEGIWVRARNK